MKRPLPLRILPDRLSQSICARFYMNRHSAWPELYKGASLRYAPQVKMDLVPGDIISDYIAFTGTYEIGFTKHVAALARRGGTMVDVGANLGYFALLWTALNPQNECFAFEASPPVVARLRRNLDQNRANVKLYPFAVGAGAGKMSFDLGPPEQTGWGGFTQGDGTRVVEVEVVRVDECIPPGTAIDLLKIDIEGADTWALQGCKGLLETGCVREVWYEENKERAQALGIARGTAESFLRSLDYEPRPVDDPSDGVVQWVATPRSGHH